MSSQKEYSHIILSNRLLWAYSSTCRTVSLGKTEGVKSAQVGKTLEVLFEEDKQGTWQKD